ncbi:protein of unknown function [Methylocella tundrae]|uniref:Uncharacterized protein n=1 Tax=Methylocella tundrae TaxID=227605 RepID=A0A4U8Z4I5_METTU|nr:protein of unknown function [Methylocella tundrae]
MKEVFSKLNFHSRRQDVGHEKQQAWSALGFSMAAACSAAQIRSIRPEAPRLKSQGPCV